MKTYTNVRFEFLDPINLYNDTSFNVLGVLEVKIWLFNIFLVKMAAILEEKLAAILNFSKSEG